jgi:hypothetical protein
MNRRRINDVFQIDSPETLIGEVFEILHAISPEAETKSIRSVFNATGQLYRGQFPGYQACNTGYHDLQHAYDALLAMARLIHGAVIDGRSFSESSIVAGLAAALLHDVGYIQEEFDTEGTGAKYKTIHEQRSMDFLKRYGSGFGLSSRQIDTGRTIIACTDMALDISTLSFASAEIELLGRMLAAADLLSQLADRAYLEKLPLLYKECKEAGIGDYRDELDLIQKAVAFYDIAKLRLQTALDSAGGFLQQHFQLRWGEPENVYQRVIDSQKDYLINILNIPDSDPREHLKRWRTHENPLKISDR